MKQFVQGKSVAELLRTHPIESEVKGWFFRIEEVSNNVWEVEARDRYGHTVSKKGPEPDAIQREIEASLKTDF